MNNKLECFKSEIKNKRVAVIGIGISNKPLIEYLVRLGAKVTACDRRELSKLGDDTKQFKTLGVHMQLGETYLQNLNHDYVFKTPGMRFDVPELLDAQKNGSIVTSEIELLFDLCPSHIIAITGSDGKTTTTTLIYKLLTLEGHNAWLGGNIGTPLLTQVENMQPNDWVILELSSFQLHTLKKSPEIAVITNISPNHLDMHKDYQEYIYAKKNIMLYQSTKDKLIVNADNKITESIGAESKADVLYFSRVKKTNAVHLNGDMIYMGDKPVLDIRTIKIPGMHNVENYMAAISAVGSMVSEKTIQTVATEFGGVDHRIELVRVCRGVSYYNSSIDSSPNRTKNTLQVFTQKVILIAGGKDKGIGYEDLGGVLVDHVKILILIGATANKIETSLKNEINRTGNGKDIVVINVSTYKEAVQTACEKAKENDIVVLSPASTSFDMFKNFEERGNTFKQLVNEIKE